MQAEALATTVIAVNEGRGGQIRHRRERLGISVRALAMRAGVDRKTLTALEAGEGVRDSTIGAVERALDELDYEMDSDRREASDPSGDVVEIRASGNFGVDVVVRGPIRDMDAMQDAVAKLVARFSSPQEQASPAASEAGTPDGE